MEKKTSKNASKNRRILRYIIPELWPKNNRKLRIKLLLAIAALVASKAVTAIVPLFYKGAVDALTTPKTAMIVVPIFFIIAYGVARLLVVMFRELREYWFVDISESIVQNLSLKSMKKLHALSLRYHLSRRTGHVVRLLDRGREGIGSLIEIFSFNLIPTILEFLFVCTILGSLFSIYYALVVVVIVAIYGTFTLFTTEWRLKYRKRMNDSENQAEFKAVDSLLNYETVKYFNNEDREAATYNQALTRYRKAAVTSIASLSVVNVGQTLIISAGLITLMIMAGYDVAQKTLTIGDFVLVNSYLIQLFVPLNFLGWVYRKSRQSLLDMYELFTLLDRPLEIIDTPQSKPLVLNGGSITFENVKFQYEDNRLILKGISFHVEPHQTVAIVGHSGAGKSTLSRLLFRFYDTMSGEISIDGQPIKEVTQESLRKAMGIVPQDTVLFNDTIFYNIHYGNLSKSTQEVYEASKMAQINDFIMSLPEGYETAVGERGLKLSGGEKQRVAIARTFLKNPGILILDEATSALDTKTERQIQSSLDSVSKGRTTLIIAHRLSTIRKANQIIVLENGKIVEQGTHIDLLQKEGVYRSMWVAQQASIDEE